MSQVSWMAGFVNN